LIALVICLASALGQQLALHRGGSQQAVFLNNSILVSNDLLARNGAISLVGMAKTLSDLTILVNGLLYRVAELEARLNQTSCHVFEPLGNQTSFSITSPNRRTYVTVEAYGGGSAGANSLPLL